MAQSTKQSFLANAGIPIGIVCIVVGYAIPRAIFHIAQHFDSLQVSPSAIHFGSVAEGMTVEKVVKLHNTSSAPIKIDIATSCGCTTVMNPGVIAQGQTVPITIKFNTTGRKGLDIKAVRITNKTGHEYARIPIDAQVSPEIHRSQDIISLGQMPPLAHKFSSIIYERVDQKFLNLRTIECPPYVSVTFVRKGLATVARFDVCAPPVPGEHRDMITIGTDDKRMPQIGLSINYRVPSEFSITASAVPSGVSLSNNALNLGFVHPGQLIKTDLVIEGKTSCYIEVASLPMGMTGTLRAVGKRQYVFSNKYYLPDKQKGVTTGKILADKIVLRTTNPLQPEIIVPVYAASE